MPKTYRIGELASLLTVAIETIRYYEKEGLLPRPARSEGNYRLYSDSERQRLEFILRCRGLDMTHQEIRQLLRLRDKPDEGCEEVNAVLDDHIEHVAERLSSLRRLQAELKVIRTRCDVPGVVGTCGVIRELGSPEKRPRSSTKSGVHRRGNIKA
jgi:Cd(II)/Pb(II)-responsive transcriptional regulator